MRERLTAALRHLDWGLLVAALVLTVFGLAAIYSLSVPERGFAQSLFVRQAAAFGVGIAVVAALAATNFRRIRAYAPLIALVALALLAGVLLLGTRIGGTKGWYVFGGFSFQPVELAKFAFVVTLARYLADHADSPPRRVLLGSLGLLGLFIAPVLVQFDIGSALLFVAVWLAAILLVGIPRRLLLLAGAALLLLAVASWFVLPDAQQARILTFLNPGRDPLGAGYNVRQSVVAIGSGQLFGRGLGLGTQSQLNFLPAAETDFIFAVIGEELGLLGAAVLLTALGYLLLRTLRLVRTTADRFARFAGAGVLALFAVQGIVNIGMNLGLAPVTGIPLPFVSYGGSALIASFAGLGLLESIVSRQRQVPTV